MPNTSQGLLKLGEPMPEWRGARPEGVHFGMDQSGLTLTHFYQSPTEREIRGARTGKMRLGLVSAGRHTLMLIYDVERLTSEWSDAPFALGIQPDHLRKLEPREPHQGRLLMSILVDAYHGTVHALRVVSLTPSFCTALEGLLDAQRDALPQFSVQAHADELRAVHAKWPTATAMVPHAVIVERGGLDFSG